MTWYCYALESGALRDGPWSYSDEEKACSAFEGYQRRVTAALPGAETHLVEAASLDALIRSRPEDFAGLRGFADLMRVDERVRMFTSLGLAVRAPLSDEDALVLAQQRLGTISLSSAVPETVRHHVRALWDLQLYGTFAYDFFGMVVTLTRLGHELALGVKFIETYDGRVPLVRADGDSGVLEATLFYQVDEAMARDGRFPFMKGWRLRDHERFRPSLAGLLRWARDGGLLREWLDQRWERARWGVASVDLGRNPPARWRPAEFDTWPDEARAAWWETEGRRRWEDERLRAIARMRNAVAHPVMHHIAMPPDGIRSLSELVEFINAVWPDPNGSAAWRGPERAV